MTDDQGVTGQPEEKPGRESAERMVWGGVLSEEDERLLHLWRESLVLQDPRYKSKVLLKFAAITMADEEFRSRLVNDTEAVLHEFQSKVDWPEGLTLRFLENTQDTLNVVLPPRSGEMSDQPVALREVLRSRTTAWTDGLFRDDFDPGDFDPIDMFGDIEQFD
jgi:hypothetical protein